MQRLVFLSMPLLLLSTPAASADLEGPAYRSPPPVVERERVIERHDYYEPPPLIVERHIYVEEPEVDDEPRIHAYYGRHAYYDRSYGYGYAGWHPRHFFPRAHYWHRHRHHW